MKITGFHEGKVLKNNLCHRIRSLFHSLISSWSQHADMRTGQTRIQLSFLRVKLGVSRDELSKNLVVSRIFPASPTQTLAIHSCENQHKIQTVTNTKIQRNILPQLFEEFCSRFGLSVFQVVSRTGSHQNSKLFTTSLQHNKSLQPFTKKSDIQDIVRRYSILRLRLTFVKCLWLIVSVRMWRSPLTLFFCCHSIASIKKSPAAEWSSWLPYNVTKADTFQENTKNPDWVHAWNWRDVVTWMSKDTRTHNSGWVGQIAEASQHVARLENATLRQMQLCERQLQVHRHVRRLGNLRLKQTQTVYFSARVLSSWSWETYTNSRHCTCSKSTAADICLSLRHCEASISVGVSVPGYCSRSRLAVFLHWSPCPKTKSFGSFQKR